jgi:hypothetical protein
MDLRPLCVEADGCTFAEAKELLEEAACQMELVARSIRQLQARIVARVEVTETRQRTHSLLLAHKGDVEASTMIARREVQRTQQTCARNPQEGVALALPIVQRTSLADQQTGIQGASAMLADRAVVQADCVRRCAKPELAMRRIYGDGMRKGCK